VRAALVSEGPPKYERKPVGSAVDAVEDAIGAQLKAVPTMPATLIAERVGWMRGMTVFKERVRELRPAYLPPDPAGRTTYEAGDIVQCDLWFPPTTVPVGCAVRWLRRADRQLPADRVRLELHGAALPPTSEIPNGSWTFPEAQPIS
jgi:hypothetical protein